MTCTKRHTNKAPDNAQPLTLEEMKKLESGDIVYIMGDCGCFLGLRINGKPQTWKRHPERVDIPIKYGMYTYGYINEHTLVKQ